MDKDTSTRNMSSADHSTRASEKRLLCPTVLASDLAVQALQLRRVLADELAKENDHWIANASVDRDSSAFQIHVPLLHRYFHLHVHMITLEKSESTEERRHGFSLFADLYAQTIVYGVLTAHWMAYKENLPFERQQIRALLSNASHTATDILLPLFDVEVPVVQQRLRDLFTSLQAVDWQDIFRGRADPVIHFYEDFLAFYEGAMRKARGVYYTPPDAVNFIVRSIDEQLQSAFGLPLGLASTQTWKQVSRRCGVDIPDGISSRDSFVRFLDPATGTGTFIKSIIEQIRNKLRHHWKQQGWSKEKMTREWGAYLSGKKGDEKDYTNNGLLSRINAFEIMAAPYMIAHLRIAWLLRDDPDMPFLFEEADRLNLFLTNALQHPSDSDSTSSYADLSLERKELNRVKREGAMTVVLGNPPYKGSSMNQYPWITGLMDAYKREPGTLRPLREAQKRWLNDDYVKFIRMGQDYIERTNIGILAYINPHGFLDNPTFRGMRWSLWTTFDTLFVLDLHGNTRRQEMAKDGSKDENIFQIMQGIAINVFLKTKETNRIYGTLYHHELYGSAKKKCRFLAEQFMGTVPWSVLSPLTECFSYHFMIPKDVSKVVSYTKGFSLIDLFRTQLNARANVLSVGLISGWDGMFIDMRADVLKKRFEDLRRYDVDKLAEMYPTFQSKKQKLRSLKSICQNKEEVAIYPIHYRPFDVRYVLYDRDLLVRPQYAVMRHLLRDNVGLIFSRTVNGAYNWQDIQITRHLVEFGIMATRVGNAAPVAPLFVYERGERSSNLNREIVSQMAKTLAVKVDILSDRSGRRDKLTSWDILDYVLAILHSNRYRRIYEELLKIDYPRVPYPEDADTFWALVEQGKELRNILLLAFEDAQCTRPTLRNEDGSIISKSEEIVCLRPCSQGGQNWNGKVWINERQYFEGISQAAWNFYIGGYKPAQKWLKDRKKTRSVPGRALRAEEVTHYGKMIRALEETMGVMEKIDRILPLD